MDGRSVNLMSKHAKAIKKIEAAFQAKKYNEAMDFCNYAISLAPKDIVAYRAKARLLQIQRDFAGAERYYDAAERRGKLEADDLVNRGIVKAEQQKYDEAIADFDKALALNPKYLHAVIQRGACQWEMRRWDEAYENFKMANEISPDDPNANWILGLLALQRNDFKIGWPLYERRWKSERFKSRPLVTQKPQWIPNSVLKSVLVWGEQGVGDQIIYASLLPAVSTMSERVTAMMDPRLLSIFKRSMPEVDFVSHLDPIPSDMHDSQIPFASVGGCFIEKLDDIDTHAARRYLKADPDLIEKYRAEIGFKKDKLTVGISWASSAIKIGPQKSVRLEEMLPFLKSDYQILNLQYGSGLDAVEDFNKVHGTNIVTTKVDLVKDFEGLAALCSLCDVIVAVSSTTVHLAGALGCKVLLMDANKLWYWGNKHGDMSAWYPNIKIFQRENMISPWDSVIKNVTKELEGIEHDRQHERAGVVG
jgi:tetratricopeptide (TPR) repeat protein